MYTQAEGEGALPNVSIFSKRKKIGVNGKF